jgi:hypothetical protein
VAVAAAIALALGITGAASPSVAGAGTANAYYVAPAFPIGIGNDANGANDCLNVAQPCATIAQALKEQAKTNPGGLGNVITVAKGKYPPGQGAVVLGAVNNDVTIAGPNAKRTIVPIAGLSANKALIDLSATTGVTISGITFRAYGVSPTFGVLGPNAPGAATLAQDRLSTGATATGVEESGGAGAQLIVTGTTLLSSLCLSPAKSSLPAGWRPPANLKVHVPGCAGGPTQFPQKVTITTPGGVITAQASLPSHTKGLVLSAPSARLAVARGATVAFSASAPAYGQKGIECSGGATCVISGDTVSAGGTVVDDPVGINVTDGAVATVEGTTVTGNTDTSDPVSDPGQGLDGIG